jgi:hypothetical protein
VDVKTNLIVKKEIGCVCYVSGMRRFLSSKKETFGIKMLKIVDGIEGGYLKILIDKSILLWIKYGRKHIQ